MTGPPVSWMIFDDHGNALAHATNKVAAHASLRALAEHDPELAAFAYDADGRLVGKAFTVADLPPFTVTLDGFTFPARLA